MAVATLASTKLRKSIAQDLLEQFGLAYEWPVPLEKLAKALEYDCFGFSPRGDGKLEGVSGFVDHEHKAIYINQDQPLTRQRFTLAHEIAHVVLHAGQAPVDYRVDMLTATDPKETDANRFASDLLMDRLLFARKWFELKGDVSALASYFGVSEDAARVRIEALKLKRV